MEEKATLAGGCFWCTEAVFQRLKGVLKVKPGYSGGDLENPTYEQVCRGNTGHAEAIQITFDPKVISYDKLLEIFWHLHDPTTLNQQGTDVGPQYRSAVFYHSVEQKQKAESIKQKIEEERIYSNPIVTEITPFKNFYIAEDYHKNYFNTHKNAIYCQVIIDPKIRKLLQEYKNEVNS